MMTPEREDFKRAAEQRLLDHEEYYPKCDCWDCRKNRDYLSALAEITRLNTELEASESARDAALSKYQQEADKAESQVQELKAEVERLNTKLNHNKCHSGHTTLPLVLWDCPECHQNTRNERDSLRTRLTALTEAAEKVVNTASCMTNFSNLLGVHRNKIDALASAVRKEREG